MNNEDRFPIVAVIHMDKFSIFQIIVGCLCIAYGVCAWFVAGDKYMEWRYRNSRDINKLDKKKFRVFMGSISVLFGLCLILGTFIGLSIALGINLAGVLIIGLLLGPLKKKDSE